MLNFDHFWHENSNSNRTQCIIITIIHLFLAWKFKLAILWFFWKLNFWTQFEIFWQCDIELWNLHDDNLHSSLQNVWFAMSNPNNIHCTKNSMTSSSMIQQHWKGNFAANFVDFTSVEIKNSWHTLSMNMKARKFHNVTTVKSTFFNKTF